MKELISIHSYANSGSFAVGNTLRATRRATCHYQQEALDKSIGTCTNNHAASTYAHNSKDIASKALFLDYKVCFMLNGKVDIRIF